MLLSTGSLIPKDFFKYTFKVSAIYLLLFSVTMEYEDKVL